MAESYITRRGSATGGAGSLNIYYGDSPPSDKVGVFCQTTSPVSNIYVEADPMDVGQNAWVIYNGVISNSSKTGTSCIGESGLVYKLYSDRHFYKFDTTSGISTELMEYTATPGYFSGCWIYNYNNLICRSGGFTQSGSNFNYYEFTDAYDYSSNIWTDSYKKCPAINHGYPTLYSYYYDYGRSYSMVFRGNYSIRGRTGYFISYDINSETTTNLRTMSLPTNNDYAYGYGYMCDYYYLFYMYGDSSMALGNYLKCDCRTNYINAWRFLFDNREDWPDGSASNTFAVNGGKYIIKNRSQWYLFDDSMNSATLQGSTTQLNPSFYIYTMIGTYGTKAYGTMTSNQNIVVSYGSSPTNILSNSIIVVSGGQNNKAELISGNSPVEINVMTSYYWDGTSLTELPTQVRTSDTAWIAI